MKELAITIVKKFLIFIEKQKAKQEFKHKQISSIEFQLKNDYLKEVRPYSSINFYQSYPPLRIRGARPTLSRFQIYDLEKHLKSDINILDIGGNTGFFSLFVSSKVNSIDVLEIEEPFARIGKKLARYEKIENVQFINKDFKKFNPSKKYDLIFSFAVHGHTKMKFKDYIEKVFSLLSKDGKVLIESHPIMFTANENLLKEELERLDFVKIISSGKLDDDGRLRTFFYITRK
ncbi:MAG: class I SAM-dependent methyltransferase [Nanoarchaeota archaeon]|nr:class I SAM-dependent methyltransferase [Nanoarchaeota archaeon]